MARKKKNSKKTKGGRGRGGPRRAKSPSRGAKSGHRKGGAPRRAAAPATDDELLRHIEKSPGESTRAIVKSFGGGSPGDASYERIAERLRAAQRRGTILELPRKGWMSAWNAPYRVGRLVASRRDGYLVKFNTDDRDADVELEDLADAVPGDYVLVEEGRAGRGRRAPQVKVIRVAERTKKSIRGRAKLTPAGLIVHPDNAEFACDFWVGPVDGADIREDDPVLVRLIEGARGTQPNAQLLVNLRDEGTLATDLEWIRAEFDLPGDHTPKTLSAAESADPIVAGSSWPDRRDLRDEFIFTIDPVDAKDFDDAISIESLEGGNVRLGVHIADVSHYVRPDSPLDQVASSRGTSVYLPSTVIPMLPERLANDLCSLRPSEDRLAKSVFMTMTEDGEVRGVDICRSVIHSKRRFTYAEIQAILVQLDLAAPPEESERVDVPDDWDSFADTLKAMVQLSLGLRRRRQERGALNLDLPKLRIIFDKNSEVVELGQETRDMAHELIEEFMLACNEAVARTMTQKNLPIVARTHSGPDPLRLDQFRDLIEAVGLQLRGGRNLSDFQRLVDDVSGMPIAAAIQLALLKTMGHAEYSDGCSLHFALATDHYCHFTSPIRRYPDLVVHQILDDLLDEKLNASRISEWKASLAEIADRSSERERRAEQAERAMLQLRLVRYLEPMLGQEFDGWIVAVLKFGFFVRLDAILIEGLVHVSSLGDAYYAFDEEEFALRASRGRRSFHMGDRVRVKLAGLDPDEREIHFELVRKLETGRE